MLRLAIGALLALSACTPHQTVPSPSPQPVPQSGAQAGVGVPATVAITLHESGLSLDIPASWTWTNEFAMVNRATQRHLLAANGPLTGLPGLPGNGDVDAAALPAGRVVVEVESFCRMACSGPTSETTLPLDWSAATPFQGRTLPSGRRELALGFRWFDRPLFLVARWADDAPPADIAAIPTIARSVRPVSPVPATGEYQGWAGLGPVANIAVGSVQLVALPAGATQGPRIYDNVPFFVVRGKQGIYAFASRALFDERCEVRYDDVTDRLTCALAGRVYEWSRFGTYLGPEPASNLTQHRVIVRDGQVWVRYVDDSVFSPSVPDEAAER